MNLKSTLFLAGGLALAAAPSFANEAKLDKLDADNDGRVTRAEFAGGALAKFVKLDGDGDGTVSTDELSAGTDQRSSGLKVWDKDDKPSADKLREADRDGDGQITRAEHEAHISAKFDSLDSNQDRVLVEAELDAAKKK